MKNVPGWVDQIIDGTADPTSCEIQALAGSVKSALKSLRELRALGVMNADRAVVEICDASNHSILNRLMSANFVDLGEIAVKEKLKCQDCGKEDATVSKGVCPFAEEITKKIEPVILCADCYRKRARDI